MEQNQSVFQDGEVSFARCSAGYGGGEEEGRGKADPGCRVVLGGVDGRLRRAFTFSSMYLGMSPFDAPGTYR